MQEDIQYSTAFLGLRTTAVPKSHTPHRMLLVTCSTSNFVLCVFKVDTVLEGHPLILRFGEVTVHERIIKHVTLTNLKPDEVQDIRIEPLPENSCFTVLNASRQVGSRPHQIAIEFCPEEAQIYSPELRIWYAFLSNSNK